MEAKMNSDIINVPYGTQSHENACTVPARNPVVGCRGNDSVVAAHGRNAKKEDSSKPENIPNALENKADPCIPVPCDEESNGTTENVETPNHSHVYRHHRHDDGEPSPRQYLLHPAATLDPVS
jgi:hypothetical protein